MKTLTPKQKEILAGKCNETRIIGDYKQLFAYVEEILNGEPNAPVKPVAPARTTVTTTAPAHLPELRIAQHPFDHPERRLVPFTYPVKV